MSGQLVVIVSGQPVTLASGQECTRTSCYQVLNVLVLVAIKCSINSYSLNGTTKSKY